MTTSTNTALQHLRKIFDEAEIQYYTLVRDGEICLTIDHSFNDGYTAFYFDMEESLVGVS